MSASWEHFPHGADIGVRGNGATKAQAFEQAALAMTAIVAEPLTIAALHSEPVECDAMSDDPLFSEKLNFLIY